MSDSLSINGLSQNGTDFLVSFLFNFAIFAVAFILFCILRPRNDTIYAPRCFEDLYTIDDEDDDDDNESESEQKQQQQQQYNSTNEKEALVGVGRKRKGSKRSFRSATPAKPSESFFSWIFITLKVPQQWILVNRGIDSFMYLRFLKSMTILFALATVIVFITVVPANSSGPNKNLNSTDPLYVDGLRIIAMSNIGSENGQLLWLHSIIFFVITLITLLFTYRDYSLYFTSKQAYNKIPTISHMSSMIFDLEFAENLKDSPISEKTKAVHQVLDRYTSGSVKSVTLVRDDPRLRKLYESYLDCAKKLAKALEKQQNGGYPTHRIQNCEEVDSVPFYDELLKDLQKEINSCQESDNSPTTKFAFVTFKDVETCNDILSLKKIEGNAQFNVRPAPERLAINWSNLYVNDFHLFIRAVGANLLIGFILFFWAIPTTFVQSLGNLRELAKYDFLSWLNDILDAIGPGVEGFLNSYLPSLLLIVLMSLVPAIIRFITKIEGKRTMIIAERVVFTRFFVFIFLNVFLVTTIAGSIFDQIFSIIEGDITIVIDLLAGSLPGQGEFFVEYVMIKFCSITLAKLARPEAVIIKWILKKLSKNGTVETSPNFCDYAINISWDVIIFLITMCYCVMFPLILPFTAGYFAISFLIQKYNSIYVFDKQYEMEGEVWKTCFDYIHVSLIISQLTMIGVISLYFSISWIFVVFGMVATILSLILVPRKIEKKPLISVGKIQFSIDQYLPHIGSSLFDEEKEGLNIPQFNPPSDKRIKKHYVQPEMVPFKIDSAAAVLEEW